MRRGKRQYLVLGMGRFGESLARNLCMLGHEVLAADHSAGAVEAVAPHVTQAVQMNATDEEALRALGPEGFDAAVVAIGNVRDSVLVTVLCKEAGVPCVVAKAGDDLHAKVLMKVGADRVVFPERDMGQRVARSMVSPNILELITVDETYRLAEIIAPESWCGRTLMDINVRRNYGLSIIAVHRQGEFIASPGADTVLRPGDVLLALGKQESIDAIERL